MKINRKKYPSIREYSRTNIETPKKTKPLPGRGTNGGHINVKKTY